MALFRLNQVPERLYVHFLNMIGISPFPPSVARAEVTFWLTAALEEVVVVPAGTQVMTPPTGAIGQSSSVAEPVVFTTLQDLVVEPPVLTAAVATSESDPRVHDMWPDLRYAPDGVRCFVSDALTPGDAFYLGFADSLAGSVLQLALAANAEGIGVDPRNPPLVWEVWNGEGWIPALVQSDTTGGLNRAGHVALVIPREHQLLTLGDAAAYWLRARLVAPAPGQPTYQASPRITQVEAAVIGGTVDAEHSESVPAEVVGRSSGGPAQSFTVSRHPVLPRREGEHVQVVGPDGTEDWVEVEDFTASTETDNHYVWDSGSGTVTFGPRVRYPDGSVRQHGRIPRDGSQILVTGYRTGGGGRGNVGAGTLTMLRSSVPFVQSATNLAAASGGVDAETVAEAKTRAPMTVRTGHRAVTARDYERLSQEASIEVARTRCLPASRGNGSVRLLVVPQVRTDPAKHQLDDFAISAPLMRTISDHLDKHRLVGTAVEVGTPFYQGVSVATLLHARGGRPPGMVRQRVVAALTTYLNPLVGGPDGTGWPFDADVNTASMAQLLEGVEGVDRVEEVLLYEYDLRTGRRLGEAKDVIRLDAHSLFLAAKPQVVVR